MNPSATRRQFLGGAALAAGTALVPGRGAASQAARRAGFKLGLASYTTRAFALDRTIEMARRTGLTELCLKSVHLALDSTDEQIAAAVAEARAAGVTLYAGGVIYMKTAEEVDRAFAYAHAAGFRLIVGVPTPELLDRAEEKVKETDIPMAIHNHGPEDDQYPTPKSVLDRIRDRDPRVGACIDVGHTLRSGVDPAAAVRACGNRLLDVHMADNADPTPKSKRTIMGRGVMDVPAITTALVEIGYEGVLAMEETVLNEEDPLPDLAESKGYLAGVLAGQGLS